MSIFQQKDINGTIVKSFVACKRQGWLASRKMSPLREEMNLAMGSVYSDARNKNTRKMGGIEIDEISKGKHIIVKEYKKTFSNIEASKMQLLFYMYNIYRELNLKTIEGYVISEETNEKLYLPFDENNQKKVRNMIDDILKIANSKESPEFIKINLCLHCAHKLYCL